MSLAYVTKAHEPRRAAVFGSMFVLGMIATRAALGVAAGLGGLWVERLLGRQWGLVLGPLLILLGLMWPGWVRLPLPSIPVRARRASGPWGALESLKVFSSYQRAFEVAGGVLLILSGLYMLNAYFIVIPALAI